MIIQANIKDQIRVSICLGNQIDKKLKNFENFESIISKFQILIFYQLIWIPIWWQVMMQSSQKYSRNNVYEL